MNYLRNNKESALVTVVGVTLAGTVALFSLYLAKRNQRATRRASLKCSCGKVQVEIYQPAANYKYTETANLQCACNDCMGYCKAVLKEGSSNDAFQKGFFDPACPTINFYDSEIVVTAGRDNLEHMKLSKKTENRRVFAKCCGTPISISPDHSHLNLVYTNILEPAKDCKENEVPFPASVLKNATVCLHAEHLGPAIIEETKTTHPQMKVIPTVVAPVEILKILARLGLLIGMGSRGPGEGFPVPADKTIGIGYESIPKQMK